MALYISEFGPNTFVLDGPGELPGQARTMWFKGSGFEDTLLVLVNKRLLTKVKISADRSLLTVELPSDLFVGKQQLSVALLDTLSDERSPSFSVAIWRHGGIIGNITEPPEVIGPKGTHVLISCFPKSGSTLLLKMLCQATGYVSCPFVYEYGGNEQDLYLPSIIDAYSLNTITQQHVRATRTNLRLIKNFGLKVVVLTRNIFDTLVSLHDHLIAESLEIPMAYVDESFARKTVTERMDYLVDIVTPWYLSFFASWSKATTLLSQGDLLVISYEELIRDKEGTVSRILTHCGCEGRNRLVDSIQLANVSVRLNVGVSGRGQQFLSAPQRARIYEIAQRYHNIDFSILFS